MNPEDRTRLVVIFGVTGVVLGVSVFLAHRGSTAPMFLAFFLPAIAANWFDRAQRRRLRHLPNPPAPRPPDAAGAP